MLQNDLGKGQKTSLFEPRLNMIVSASSRITQRLLIHQE